MDERGGATGVQTMRPGFKETGTMAFFSRKKGFWGVPAKEKEGKKF